MDFVEQIREFLTTLYGDALFALLGSALFISALLLITRGTRWVEFQLIKTSRTNPILKRIRRVITRVRKASFYTGSLFIALYVAICGYYISQGKTLYTIISKLLADHAFSQWQSIGIVATKVIAIFVLLPILTSWINKALKYCSYKTKKIDQITSNDQQIEHFYSKLKFISVLGIWCGAIIMALNIVNVPIYVIDSAFLLLRIYFILSIGFLIVSGVDVLIASLDAVSVKYANRRSVLKHYHEVRPMIPLLRRCLEYAIYIYVATLVLQQLQLTVVAQYGPKLVQVIGIFFLARVLLECAKVFIRTTLIKDGVVTDDEDQRRLTIAPIASSVAKYATYFIAIILIMQTLEIDATPILAGAGIVGLVIGFGAQPLINDIVSGFFIIFENLYYVGDYIETGTARGVVEGIDIRTTRIRDPDGQQHILRNGQIGEIINYSKGYANAVVLVGIDYKSNLDNAYAVIETVGSAIQTDHPDVMEKTRVDGLEDFGESQLLIRTVTKVRPGKHLNVARQLRKKLKEAFDEAGIEIPFPRRVIYMNNKDNGESTRASN